MSEVDIVKMGENVEDRMELLERVKSIEPIVQEERVQRKLLILRKGG